MEGGDSRKERLEQDHRYDSAVKEFGAALDRIACGYEADPDKRRDLRQEIHLQLWRSLRLFDGRCALKTWVFRVAHNTAVSYVARERRSGGKLVSLEEVSLAAPASDGLAAIDEARVLARLSELIRSLQPLDRQIMLSYLEGMDAAAIAEITGLSAAHVSVKVHRIKTVLARHILQEQQHA